MSAAVQSIISAGAGGIIVDIECHLSNNLPTIVIVGFANKAVDESKERIRGAFATSHIMLPRKRITINLAPADVPKADSGFDLAIAVAILLASGQLPLSATDNTQAFIGELGLDGSVRPVRGVIGKLLTGRAKGLATFYIPAANLEQAQLVPNVKLFPVSSLADLLSHLAGTTAISPVRTGRGKLGNLGSTRHNTPVTVALSEVVGQPLAKQALEIAAAGGHNVFFSGPPGTGKSMLAKSLASILPALTRDEVLEVTHLHSLASQDYEQIVTQRPFRSPHHSASQVAVIGGGFRLRPGEISLAHRGVLFLDELPEFSRSTLEALRQPLEDQLINIARADATVEYPANFVLVATANPCPCGYAGSSGSVKCRCSRYQKLRYRRKLSGPILDRIDLYSNVHEVHHDRLLTQPPDSTADEAVRQRVHRAQQAQRQRYRSNSKLNADMTNADIKQYGCLDSEATALLNTAAGRLNISARAYMRTIKVARTIADLKDSAPITTAHISEALAYRVPRYRE